METPIEYAEFFNSEFTKQNSKSFLAPMWSGIDAMMMALINEFSSTTASFTEGHYRLNSTIRLKVILLIICLILDTSAVAKKISV